MRELAKDIAEVFFGIAVQRDLLVMKFFLFGDRRLKLGDPCLKRGIRLCKLVDALTLGRFLAFEDGNTLGFGLRPGPELLLIPMLALEVVVGRISLGNARFERADALG